MKSELRPTSARRYVNHLPLLLFLICTMVSFFSTYYVSTHYIDSDTSSELVLANHLIESGKLLSPDWFYGSELRFLHVQWIYVPLLLLLDDWQMVRFFGALIMQALYIASFGCLVHAAGKSRKFFLYGASLLLLPVSVTYGRIVLYHSHYMPNITLSFLMLALVMGFVNNVNWRSRKTWLRLFLLSALSFAGGLNSIRQLMITHVPLLLAAFLLCWVEDAASQDSSTPALLRPANLNLLICALIAALFSYLGLITQEILCDKLGIHIFIQSENNTLSFEGFDFLADILYGFFHQFGYRGKNISLLSLSGILCLGSIFTGCYLILISAKRLLASKSYHDRRPLLLSIFFLVYTAVMAFLFLCTKGAEEYYYPLYLSLCFPWAVPLLLSHWESLPAAVHSLHVKRLFASVAVAVLLLSGTINHFYFQGSEHFPQTYEGLAYHNRNHKEDLTEVVNLLMEQGYDKGYASYWDCNILSEMSNGDITMVLIHDPDDSQSGNLTYRNLLTALWFRESPSEKSFLLIDEILADTFLQSDSSVYCTQIYCGYNHVAYHIDNVEEFVKTLYS